MTVIPAPPPAPIITMPTGTDEQTLADLKAGGYVVIVTDYPERITFLQPPPLRANLSVPADVLLLSAMQGLSYSGMSPDANAAMQTARSNFFSDLHKRLKEAATPATPKA